MKDPVINSYQQEHIETLRLVRSGLGLLSPKAVQGLRNLCEPYMAFRQEVDHFLACYFSDVCTRNCYESRLSACCSKDGIIAFFADVVVNALASTNAQLDQLEMALGLPNDRFKCVYLSNNGCLWAVKPIVCQMFLCDSAQKTVFLNTPGVEDNWKHFREKEKVFKWPDKPVLFDRLEKAFLDLGIDSPLMYFHHSPGLLMVKQKAGLLNSK